MRDSTTTDARLFDLERDLPTTAEDVEVMRALRIRPVEGALTDLRRLLAPGWTLEAAAARPTFEGCPPFEL